MATNPISGQSPETQETKTNPKSRHWLVEGLIWGAMMYVIIVLIMPTAMGDEITTRSLLTGIPAWTLGGIAFGYVVMRIRRKSQQ